MGVLHSRPVPDPLHAGGFHELAEHGLFFRGEKRCGLPLLPGEPAVRRQPGGWWRRCWAKLIALRSFQRARNSVSRRMAGILGKAGLDEAAAARLYRLFTIAGVRRAERHPGAAKGGAGSETRKGASGFGILSKAGRGK